MGVPISLSCFNLTGSTVGRLVQIHFTPQGFGGLLTDIDQKKGGEVSLERVFTGETKGSGDNLVNSD